MLRSKERVTEYVRVRQGKEWRLPPYGLPGPRRAALTSNDAIAVDENTRLPHLERHPPMPRKRDLTYDTGRFSCFLQRSPTARIEFMAC